MTGLELNAIYGAVISPNARIAVPDSWMPAIREALRALCELPTEVRAFLIVKDIGTDPEGDLAFHVAVAGEFISSDGMLALREITDRALAATSKIGVQH